MGDPQQTAADYALAWKRARADGAGSAEAVAARGALRALDAGAVRGLNEKRSFWINVYNGAVIDRALGAEVRESVKEVRGFFRRRFLDVAGVPLSLDEIEHGFLRRNRRPPARLLPPLLFRPGRKPWMVRTLDPRIHFALNCGARSCPPFAVYEEMDLDARLEAAARTFLTFEVGVDPAERTITANPILRWYRRDFGDLESWIRRYRGDLDPGPWTFRWRRYDWSW